ncbi:PREDICTED: class I histocompatibility antigen, F10 alpha chain-like isoform X2 [Gekko japonicus]|uniref:Class I histocompatibility antigen, F10 alpha chain-like isoform X2 n=1 Tax=Gekko japonicus TaxID=146911 RepID=A0ABM1LAI6_GEKJA|nr:PREDICTED: class I histocompatibility antigen, F10 alpha chain-like isoform X2 [Gekko japonicus]
MRSGRRFPRGSVRTRMGFLQSRLLLLGAIALLLPSRRFCAGPSALHTLHYFATALWERGWQIPQYACSVYLDDQLIGHYDGTTDRCMPQSSWIAEISHDDSDFWARSTRGAFASSLVPDLMILKNMYNQSRGIHTLQVLFGCELSGDGRTPRGFAKYGYNGRDFLSLDFATLTWTAMDAEVTPIKRKWDAEHRGKVLEHFLAGSCVEWLHTHLRYGKEVLLRADPPMALITRKTGSDGLETLVCQLRGFYPKEIAVTWRKGGEVWHQDTSHGGVVPNSDGTYHTWLGIKVDPKEKDHFRCHVEHDGLPKPLDLAWEEPAPVSNVGLIVGVVLGIVAALVLVGAGVIFHTRKPREDSYQEARSE